MMHSGTETLIHKLRDRFWIVRARRTVKQALGRCRICKRYKSKPCQQRFAPLPPDRCESTSRRPFESTGMDYFGPICSPNVTKKCYVLLFTCMHIRAVHLEITESLDTTEFLLAFDRFVSRRGCPTSLRSDNAKTFKCASAILARKHQIVWTFSTERAPWTGGCWERMVRSVKTALRFVLKHSRISYTELCSYLCRAKCIVNSRPFTFCSGNDSELRPLSPNDFLLPVLTSNRANLPRDQLLQSFLNCNRQLLHFWNRWKREYVRSLLSNKSKSLNVQLKLGDVVLLDEGCKRQFWPLCRVVELCPGADAPAAVK